MQTFLESFRTPNDVYKFCSDNGIKGYIGNCHTCAIAEMIKTQYPERFEDGEQISVHPHGDVVIARGKKIIATWPLPLPLSVFAFHFDMGDHADLMLAPILYSQQPSARAKR